MLKPIMYQTNPKLFTKTVQYNNVLKLNVTRVEHYATTETKEILMCDGFVSM